MNSGTLADFIQRLMQSGLDNSDEYNSYIYGDQEDEQLSSDYNAIKDKFIAELPQDTKEKPEEGETTSQTDSTPELPQEVEEKLKKVYLVLLLRKQSVSFTNQFLDTLRTDDGMKSFIEFLFQEPIDYESLKLTPPDGDEKERLSHQVMSYFTYSTSPYSFIDLLRYNGTLASQLLIKKVIEDKENKLNYYHILAVMKVLLCYSFEKTYVEISKDFILHLFDLCEMSPVKEFISYLFSPDIDDENKDAITRQRLDYESRLNEWRIMPEMMSRIYDYENTNNTLEKMESMCDVFIETVKKLLSDGIEGMLVEEMCDEQSIHGLIKAIVCGKELGAPASKCLSELLTIMESENVDGPAPIYQTFATAICVRIPNQIHKHLPIYHQYIASKFTLLKEFLLAFPQPVLPPHYATATPLIATMHNPNIILPNLVLDDQDSIIAKHESHNLMRNISNSSSSNDEENNNNNNNTEDIPKAPAGSSESEPPPLPTVIDTAAENTTKKEEGVGEEEKPKEGGEVSVDTSLDTTTPVKDNNDKSLSPITPIRKSISSADSSQLLEKMEDEDFEQPPFTILRLELLTIINSVVQTKPELLSEFGVELWSVLSDWLVLYPHNNMYHSIFTTIYIAALKYNPNAIQTLINECKFWNKLLPYYHRYGPFVSLYPYLSIMLYETHLVYTSLKNDKDSWINKCLVENEILKQSLTNEESMGDLRAIHITSWTTTQQYLSQRFIPTSMYRFNEPLSDMPGDSDSDSSDEGDDEPPDLVSINES